MCKEKPVIRPLFVRCVVSKIEVLKSCGLFFYSQIAEVKTEWKGKNKMKTLTSRLTSLAAMLCISLFFSCSSDNESPPASDNSSAVEIGVLPSSSSSLPAAGKVLCLLGEQCLYIPAADCSVIGGQEVQKCALESSSSPAITTTSSGSVVQLPSSNSIEQTISSSSAMLTVSSSSLVSNVVLCLFNGSCVSIDAGTCSSIGGLQVQNCSASPVSSGSSQPSSASVQLSSSGIQQLQSSSSVAIITTSSSSASATRCKDTEGREYFCKWDSGCFAIDPAFASGQACSDLLDECRLFGSLYVNSTVEGEKRSCTGTLIYGSSSSSSSSIVVISGTFTDSRDGKVYKKVTIGTQTWMAENLNYNATDSWCYDNDPDNCAIYGRLYNWNTAMTACPTNWHLPNDTEWKKLTDFVGWPVVPQLAMYGFTVLLGGLCSTADIYYSYYNFDRKGTESYWWSSSEETSTYASYWFSDGDFVSKGSYDKLWWVLSVRCLQD